MSNQKLKMQDKVFALLMQPAVYAWGLTFYGRRKGACMLRLSLC